MSASPAPAEPAPADAELEATVDEVVTLCGGDQRAALRALVTANDYLNAEVERMQALISRGYARASRR